MAWGGQKAWLSSTVTSTSQAPSRNLLSLGTDLCLNAMKNSTQEYDDRIEGLRRDEYPVLCDQTYLDHAGMTIPAKSLMDTFARTIYSDVYGNPHSASTSFHATTTRIEDVRLRVLQMFKADPADFDLVFVANATAGVKLVAEALREAPHGFNYLYHQSSHTSLVGLRQEAKQSVCLDDVAIESWLAGGPSPIQEKQEGITLFSYPAQSNLDGTRYPLDWPGRHRIKKRTASSLGFQHLSLLDAAAYVSTEPLDFSNLNNSPDFTVLSFYKIFGFPDLGALIVRREIAPVLLKRRYFGGGTVEAVICQEDQWHARKDQSVHEALEDGTLPIHNIIALDVAMDTHLRLFGSMQEVSSHTSFLNGKLHDQLGSLRHGNGAPVCALYSKRPGRQESSGTGAIATFNILGDAGESISPGEFQKVASLKGFHVRTGGVCNPGGIARVLHLTSAEIKHNYSQGVRCGDESDVLRGKPTGIIRVSLGAMSTRSDIEKFISFLREFYTSTRSVEDSLVNNNRHRNSCMFIDNIVVFPIKSCQGFRVPSDKSWRVRPEGLMWDREWCLVNRATNRILTQKRYPRMAFLRPFISLEKNMLTVHNYASTSEYPSSFISLPLSPDVESEARHVDIEQSEAKIIGVGASVRMYTSKMVNGFFSDAIGVPCTLARICHPAKPQGPEGLKSPPGDIMPGSYPDESLLSITPERYGGYLKKSLSNESPILAINLSSVRKLNKQIAEAGSPPVSTESFRANLILGSNNSSIVGPAYSEDHWTGVKIGSLKLRVVGPCQRCHMVCIDPKTATQRPEPYLTLSKTRRFDGKIYFGSHLSMENDTLQKEMSEDEATLTVGDEVTTNV